MYANEFKTKGKQKLTEISTVTSTVYVLYLFLAETKKIFLPF